LTQLRLQQSEPELQESSEPLHVVGRQTEPKQEPPQHWVFCVHAAPLVKQPLWQTPPEHRPEQQSLSPLHAAPVVEQTQ
jgi:hypothetical protein